MRHEPSLPAWSELGQRLPMLALLPEALKAQARRVQGQAGDVLARRGDVPERICCVLSGELRLLRRDSEGRELILQRWRQGFAAEGSLDSATYHCDLVCGLDSDWLQWPIAVFREAIGAHPDLQRAWRGHLVSELRHARARLERLHLRRSVDRVLHAIATEGQDGRLVLTLPRNAWATELGLSPENLYRTLRQLRESGRLVIETDEAGRTVLLSPIIVNTIMP